MAPGTIDTKLGKGHADVKLRAHFLHVIWDVNINPYGFQKRNLYVIGLGYFLINFIKKISKTKVKYFQRQIFRGRIALNFNILYNVGT